ncbi:MAG: hypothetical protein H6727_05530 [Myxococcales bacterium]|nr:hypothetical protein [Myxococcales bacterium]
MTAISQTLSIISLSFLQGSSVKRSFLWGGALCMGLLLFVSAAPAGAAGVSPEIKKESERCFNLYRKKFFLQATKCYEELRKKHKSPQYLVNIAQSYRLAALNQVNPDDAASLREKAIQTLQQYKKEAPQSNFWSDSMIQKLETAIGYTGVNLTATPADAQFVLKGNKTEKKGILPLATKLRPGNYTIELTAKGHEAKEHSFEVKAGKPVSLQLILVASAAPKDGKKDDKVFDPAVNAPKSPNAARKPSMLFWIIAAAGVAMIATGVAFVGVGVGNQGQLNDPNTSAKQARDALYQSGWQTPTGWTFVGLGVAAGVGAAVVFFMTPKKPEEPAKDKLSQRTTHSPERVIWTF